MSAARPRLTRVQREVLAALRRGARLWHPYVRDSGEAWLVGPGPLEGRRVQYRTIDRLCDLGVIDELEDDKLRPMGSSDGDVQYVALGERQLDGASR